MTTRWLELLAASSFALTSPLLSLLEHHPEFLVAHRTSSSDLAWLVIALTLVLPTALLGAEAALTALWRRGQDAVHASVLGLLVAITLLPPFDRVLGMAAPVPAIALGLAAGVAWLRVSAARRLVRVLGVAPLIFAAAFWTSDPIRQVRDPAPWSLPPAANPSTPTSVVLLVLDSLPLVTLLDAGDRIDSVRFPGFARLANRATWLRNTVAASEGTHFAVPSILTGRLPDPDRLPTVGDHPNNLFTLLRESHVPGVSETRTMLSPIGENLPARRGASPSSAFISDLAILYAHVVTPRPWRERLPPVTEDWRDFAPTRPADLTRIQRRSYGTDRPEQFRRFVRELSTCPRPCLDFLHIVFPHTPWTRAPSGRAYSPIYVPGINLGRWQEWDFWVAQGQQRHIFQALVTDRLVGELLDRLDALDRFDTSLLVVVADHGSSYWPGQSRRLLEGHAHPEDILRVPFFVKAPGQQVGRIDDRRAHAVDVLPTVAEILDITVPWQMDGRSVVGEEPISRSPRTSYTKSGEALRFSGDLDVSESVARKLASFPSAPGDEGLFAIGEHGRWVGTPVADLDVGAPSRCRVEIAREAFVLTRLHVPMRISGFVRCGPRRKALPQVGIAIGGIVQSVAPSFATRRGDWLFSTFVSETVLDEGIDLDVYLFEGDVAAPKLRPTRFSLEPIVASVVKARVNPK